MSVKKQTTHVVSNVEPTGLDIGDEWFNPTSNLLYKRVAISGKTVGFSEVLTSFSKSSYSNNITTADASALTLSTNNNVSSGSITITPNANGVITISPGSAGLAITGPTVISSTLQLTGAGGVTLSDSNAGSTNAALRLQNNATASEAGIQFYGSSGTWLGEIYTAGGNGYGFLASQYGAWDIKKIPNGAMTVRISGTDNVVAVSSTVWARSFALMGA